MKKLLGKWALVTGSSRGIGQRVALALAERGCNVIVHGRTVENTAATCELLADIGVETQCVGGELDSPDSVAKVIAAVRDVQDRIDILVNNAAINNDSTPVFEFPMSDWQKTFQVNVFAVAQLCAAFIPDMKDQKWGRVVNVTSGIAGQPNLAPYSASKAALDKYTQDLAVECEDSGVLVNHVDPGWIRTDLGGPEAWENVDSVIPGMIVPILLANSGANGRFYAAQDFKGLWDY